VRCSHCGFENPAEYAFCGRCGQPLLSAGGRSRSPVGERRFVTVLFVHIPGFLALSRRLDPEEACRLINACVEALSVPVYKYGGTVDKFIGQELMAVFGAPEIHEDDTARALWAALEMMETVERFNLVNKALLPEPLTIQCGANAGLVFAGEVGTPGLRAFTVIGDAVNLASRLAHLAEPGQVFVGEAAYRQALRLFRFRPLPPLTVRGRLQAVPVYVLLSARERHLRAWGMSGLSSPLVGRTQELATLSAHIRRLQAGQGGIVSLVGEAGVGKSRLVAEARAAVHGPRWLEGCGFPFQVEQPYFPFRDSLQRYLDLDEGIPAEEARRRLWEMIARFMPGEEESVYPFLLYLLGLPPDHQSTAVLEPLSGEGLRHGFFQAVRMLLRGMAQDRPTVMVVEDLHWADESSLSLLTYLMSLAQEVPILFLPVLRPEPRHGLLQAVRDGAMDVGLYSEVRIEPLSWDESATLIANLLRTDHLPHTLQRRILEKAEGNPLFVEEIIRSLIQDRVLVEREGRWEVAREVGVIHIPDTLRGLLVSRVDRLEPEVRETLRRAAVIGRVFLERVLAVLSGDGEMLAQHLRLLLDRNFIRYYRLEGEQGKAYIFNHALTHEATYRTILRDKRCRLHRLALEEMERLCAGRQEAHYGTLARHAYLGEVWDKAVRYLHLAGDRAKAAYALPEAVRNYRRAMGIVQEHGVQLSRERLADLYHECCSAQSQLGDYDAARTVCSVLMEMGESQHDPYLRGHALRGAALVATYTGDTVAQVSSARAACQELEAAGADWSRGTALFLLALGLFKSGQLDEASAAIEEGLRLVGDARRWPGYDPRSEALSYAGLIALVRGRLAEAIDLLKQGEERAERTGEQVIAGFCLGFASLAYGFLGDYALALQKAEEGIRVGEGADLPAVVYTSSACAGWAHAMAGHYGPAIRRARPAAAKAAVSNDTRAIAHVALGDAYLGLLDFETGLTHHQKALEVAGLTHIVTTTAMRGIGLAYVLLGRIEQGLASLSSSLAAATAFGLKWFRAQTLRDVARACLLAEDPAAALAYAEELVALAGSAGYKGLVGWGYLLRGLVAGDEGDIRRALDVAHDLGCLSLQWEAGEALSRVVDSEEGRTSAQAAVREISDGLPAERRTAFLSQERVRSLLGREGVDSQPDVIG